MQNSSNVKSKFICFVAFLFLFLTGCIAGSANNTLTIPTGEEAIFPQVNVSDLNGKDYLLPNDLKSQFTLIALGFAHEQKEVLKGWLEISRELEEKFPGLAFYKIPVIDNSNAALRLMITNGMRAKADEETRRITLPLFVNKDKFIEALRIADDKEPEILLISNDGKILWSERGSSTSKKTDALLKFLSKVSKMKNAGP